ncbi:hypothetical protein [Acinetobacter baumannii]|uniref:hypothetical protein n=1 Tax=Acinetobacter baumannii TaxID=470 RepID=UPI000DE74EEE|nr:hypothetical protein [Acinetobacter baumannii]SSU86377.1 Uncharacterised protein [Acinetobacter baumannii]
MTDLNNPDTIEIHGLRTITKLCHFGADNNMEGCTFTEIVERLFAELEKAKAQAVPENHIVVPRTREIVVAIEKIVQQQCDASGFKEPLHRLDGWRILEEIAEKVKEIKG